MTSLSERTALSEFDDPYPGSSIGHFDLASGVAECCGLRLDHAYKKAHGNNLGIC